VGGADSCLSPTSLWRDGAVLATAGSVLCVNLAAALCEPLVPLWLGGPPLRYGEGLTGVIFSSATFSYLSATALAGPLANAPARRGKLLVCGTLLASLGLVGLGLVPAAGDCAGDAAACSLPVLIVSMLLIGAGVATVDTPALPVLSAIAESRGDGNLGTAGAIEAAAMSAGLTLGPLLGAPLVGALGGGETAPWLADGLAPAAWAAAALCFVQALITWRLVALPLAADGLKGDLKMDAVVANEAL